MTGYGRAVTVPDPSGDELAWVVEVRSVNHRGLDLKIRSAEPDAYCDVEIARLVKTAVERGAVTVNLTPSGEADPLPGPSAAVIRRTHAALDEIRQALGIPGAVDLATIAAFLNLELAQSGKPPGRLRRGEALWTTLRPALEAALRSLGEMRQREGRDLTVDLTARLARLEGIIASIATALEPLPERYARRLHERLAPLRELPGYEFGRVAEEVALLADRLDVSEELVRLGAHLAHARALFADAGSVGRKLDFLIQEIGREINTLGSKAQDSQVAGLVIEAKSELEKIREQAQNIE